MSRELTEKIWLEERFASCTQMFTFAAKNKFT